MPAACRWSRPTSRSSRRADDYEAHDALICHRRGRGHRRRRPPAADAGALFQDRAPRWRRSSPTCPRRSTTRSRSRMRCACWPRDAEADPAALRRRDGRRRRRPMPAEARAAAAQARATGSRAGSPRTASRPGSTEEDYATRLDFELGVIERMKYPGYFLIVADFIQWAKAQGIPVGPGRGSGAGSLVAWSLTITDLDPLRFDLLFERFLNPDRVSMPDFDIDFCQDRRDEVIRYVQEKYGARPGRADHHLRHAAGARRAARRRPRAADALRPGRPARQAGAAEPGQPGDARRRRSTTSRDFRPSATRSDRSRACSTSRRSSKASTATPRPTPPASSSATGR